MRFGIKRSMARSNKERFAIVLLACVDIGHAIITILSLGFIVTEWQAKVLFSEWYDQFCDPQNRR